MNHQKIVDSISYKPGWKFRYDEEEHKLIIKFTTEDSRQMGEHVHLTFAFPWDQSYHFYTADFVWEKIQQIERHEMREWFMIEGHLVYDPHTTTTEEFHLIR